MTQDKASSEPADTTSDKATPRAGGEAAGERRREDYGQGSAFHGTDKQTGANMADALPEEAVRTPADKN
jgi:hypothetical protein